MGDAKEVHVVSIADDKAIATKSLIPEKLDSAENGIHLHYKEMASDKHYALFWVKDKVQVKVNFRFQPNEGDRFKKSVFNSANGVAFLSNLYASDPKPKTISASVLLDLFESEIDLVEIHEHEKLTFGIETSFKATHYPLNKHGMS